MVEKLPKIIVIAGATASGKTSLAVKVADKFNGEIISADSRQVYRGMDIGTGKDLDEYTLSDRKIPYHLIDVADPNEIFTLFHYQQLCYKAFLQILSKNRTPILVGGTGLYIEAVLKNYSIPNIPEDIDLRKKLMSLDKETLINQLKNSDRSLFSSTDISSKKRVVRALEIVEYSKNNSVEWGVKNPPSFNPIIICTKWDRGELIKRIDSRLSERFDSGMVGEVESLMENGVTQERLKMFGMEYKHILNFINKRVDFDDMKNQLATDIHRLAKRQMTYFRGLERRGLKVEWVENGSFSKTEHLITNFLASETLL